MLHPRCPKTLRKAIVSTMTRHRKSGQETRPASATARPKAGPVNLRREVRSLLVIAAPLAAAYLAEIAMMITDMAIVGRLGSVQLAAVGLAGDLMMEVMLFCMAIVSMVGVLVAQAIGAGDADSGAHHLRQRCNIPIAAVRS